MVFVEGAQPDPEATERARVKSAVRCLRIESVLTELVAADEAHYEHSKDCQDDPCSTCFSLSAVVEGLFAKARLTLRNR